MFWWRLSTGAPTPSTRHHGSRTAPGRAATGNGAVFMVLWLLLFPVTSGLNIKGGSESCTGRFVVFLSNNDDLQGEKDNECCAPDLSAGTWPLLEEYRRCPLSAPLRLNLNGRHDVCDLTSLTWCHSGNCHYTGSLSRRASHRRILLTHSASPQHGWLLGRYWTSATRWYTLNIYTLPSLCKCG